jgi:hypothetical protein
VLKRSIMPKKHKGNRTDAFIRWRFKNSFARVEPPSGGKKRLLQAAYAETKSSASQYSHLNTLIETEQYQDHQVYLAWVLASRFHMAILSSIKMR